MEPTPRIAFRTRRGMRDDMLLMGRGPPYTAADGDNGDGRPKTAATETKGQPYTAADGDKIGRAAKNGCDRDAGDGDAEGEMVVRGWKDRGRRWGRFLHRG